MTNSERYPGSTAMMDIIVFEHYGDDVWAQTKYLAHGIKDVFWTNNIDDALEFLKESIERRYGNNDGQYRPQALKEVI